MALKIHIFAEPTNCKSAESKPFQFGILFRARIMLLTLAILITISLTKALCQTEPRIQSEFQPSTEVTDGDASAALHRTIDAMGGLELWNRVGSAIVRYQYDVQAPNKIADRIMLDDWSTDNIRYSRGTVGMTATSTGHNGNSAIKVFSAKTKSPVAALPEFDQARVLASHLPAAAALVILRNPLYLARTSPTCSTQSICLTIYRRSTPQGVFRVEQVWTISKSTYLPEKISIAIPVIGQTTTVKWKTVLFYSYQSEQGTKVPKQIAVAISGIKGPTQTLTSIKLSTGYDLDMFAQEVRK